MVFQQINDKRGGLTCSLTSHKTQSAHCLRMDPLWYHIYDVQAMSYWYQIQMTITSCPNTEGKAAASKDCTSKTLTLDPSNTVVYDGSSPSTSAVQATLIGDYSSFAKAPDFENKYLAVPAGVSGDACSGPKDPSRKIDLHERCSKHIQEGMDKWMLVDKHLFGDECNKIGVTYENFRFQSGFCDRVHGSCTKNQLADYYDYDQKQDDQNKIGKYWLSSMSHAGLIDLTVADGQSGHSLRMKKKNVRLMFKSNRFQNTLIKLQIKATDVSLTTNVAKGEIQDWQIRNFETGSNDGGIKVQIKNTDTRNVYAQFILTIVDCDKGVVPSTEAGQAIRSLTGQQVMTIPFNVMYSVQGSHTNDHVCTAQLLNAAGEKLDSKKMTFKTWDTTIHRQNSCTDDGSSCGDAATGKPSKGTGHGKCECGAFDFKCYTKNLPDMTVFSRCSTQITTMIITIVVVVGCLIVLCICCKVLGPKRTMQLLCLPFKCCAECCKCGMDICFDNDNDDRGYSRHRSSRRPRRHKKKKKRKKKKKKQKKKRRHSSVSSLVSESDSCSSDESSGEYSEEPRSPREYYKAPAARHHRVEIPLAEVAANQDGDVSREEMYNYANYFDNTTTSVFFNVEANQKMSFCNMEGQPFSIRGELSGRDGNFIFTVPHEDRYVTREMCNGELCDLDTPRPLSDEINEIALSEMEVYWHISEEEKVVAINV